MVSKKSGQVYERRLIVKYIEDNGKDPVNGEELSVEDLLDIKTSTFATSAYQQNAKRRNTMTLRQRDAMLTPMCCF